VPHREDERRQGELVSTWLKKMAVVLVLLGLLSVMLPLAWRMLEPALPILFLTGVAIAILIRIFKKPGDGW
jgi:hypothetical protein